MDWKDKGIYIGAFIGLVLGYKSNIFDPSLWLITMMIPWMLMILFAKILIVVHPLEIPFFVMLCTIFGAAFGYFLSQVSKHEERKAKIWLPLLLGLDYILICLTITFRFGYFVGRF